MLSRDSHFLNIPGHLRGLENCRWEWKAKQADEEGRGNEQNQRKVQELENGPPHEPSCSLR